MLSEQCSAAVLTLAEVLLLSLAVLVALNVRLQSSPSHAALGFRLTGMCLLASREHLVCIICL